MTIGDEKVVAWLDEGGISWDTYEEALKFCVPPELPRGLIPKSAYAELAAELAESRERENWLVAAHDQALKDGAALQSQLAELRGKCEGLAAKWEEGTENRENETGYVRGVDFAFAKCANELRTLAAADGGCHAG